MIALAQEAAAANINWAELVNTLIFIFGAIGLWLRQRSTDKKIDKTNVKVEEAKEAAENGHALRKKMADDNDALRQEVATLTIQRDTFRDIVGYINKRPEPQIRAALTAYAERRQVAAYDPKLEGLLSGIARPGDATPRPSSFSLPTWAPWVAAGVTGAAALVYALVCGRRER